MEYRCVATSVEGFIQQLAVNYISKGYRLYVTGCIPEGKNPEEVDRKLVEKYEIGISKWERSRRKLQGVAGVHYLRHGRFFVIVATHGHHKFFAEEAGRVRNVSDQAIKYARYSVAFRNGHVSVRIEREAYRALKAHFVDLATRRSAEKLGREFRKIPFEPYAPIRSQVLVIWRAVNKKRKTAGFEPVPKSWLRLKRSPVTVFARSREAA